MADQGVVFRHYWTICIVDTLTPQSKQESCPLDVVYGGSGRSIPDITGQYVGFIGGRC